MRSFAGKLRDRRAVARYADLPSTPGESGKETREGPCTPGNARGRREMIQLAWRFLPFGATRAAVRHSVRGLANISVRKHSPVFIIAQVIRASLLAGATVTSRAGFFAKSPTIQSRKPPRRFSTTFKSDVAPRTSSFLMYRFPALVMAPRVGLPPLEICLGVSPSQAAKSRPELNTPGSGTLAAITEATSLPVPGSSPSERLVSLSA